MMLCRWNLNTNLAEEHLEKQSHIPDSTEKGHECHAVSAAWRQRFNESNRLNKPLAVVLLPNITFRVSQANPLKATRTATTSEGYHLLAQLGDLGILKTTLPAFATWLQIWHASIDNTCKHRFRRGHLKSIRTFACWVLFDLITQTISVLIVDGWPHDFKLRFIPCLHFAVDPDEILCFD